jgi:hypothetical protein
MKTPEQIEADFTRFFKSIGYSRVSDLVGPSPSFKNADYLNSQDRIVVELKIIDKDYFSEGGIIDRFCGLIPKPVNIDERGLGLYTVAWPSLNREGRCDTFEEPMRRILKDANRQLRDTRNHIFQGQGWGFVFIALNGFTSLHPDLVVRMLNELLEREFSSITGYALCTPIWGFVAPHEKPVERYCHGSVMYGTPETIQTLWYAVVRQWCSFATASGY